MYARDFALIATPIGMVRISGTEAVIERISIEPQRASMHNASADAIARAADLLAAWFAGEPVTFNLPLAPAATERGEALRSAMAAIPCGETMSYGALATSIASSARAIGQACARNPFPIVVPCHRILNADGSVGAYSTGDGPAAKRWLLDHEQRHRMRMTA